MLSNRNLNYDPRASRRGTLLVVVLGLLVALFIIGTSFSFVTLSERRAAANYLDRQRALDLALDGMEYSVARLRAEAMVNHYEGLSNDHAGVENGAYNALQYSLRALDGPNPAVTWPRDKTSTSAAQNPDANWVDYNSNGQQDGNETAFGGDKFGGGQGGGASIVTQFGGDGININQVRNRNVDRVTEGADYGPSGTYEPLGDYFRVRAIDAASLLNLDNFQDSFNNQLPDQLRGKRFNDVLLTLGDAIDVWVSGGEGSGRYNPFPPEIVRELFRMFEASGGVVNSMEDLRTVYLNTVPAEGNRLFELARNFVTVGENSSRKDLRYRDWTVANQKVVEGSDNPYNLSDQVRMRAGWSQGDNGGQDAWPAWQPQSSGPPKAPININTAPKPVLVALFAGIEARARLLFYQKQDLIAENNKLIFDKFNFEVPQMKTGGTTDIGRQNYKTTNDEQYWQPGGGTSLGIFQMVGVGPIETRFGASGQSSTTANAAENAGELADLVVRLRSQDGPFQSWQDFDARFFRQHLLKLKSPVSDRNAIQVPDLVGVDRRDLQGLAGGTVNSAYPTQLLPLPDNCNHPANPIKSSDSAMTQGDFRAWYWKSVVDMLRAALCPSNITNRYNADYPYHQNVDRMDLIATTAPVCFSSLGRFEIVSVGEIMAPEQAGQTTSGSVLTRQPVARRKVRGVVEVYDVWKHSSQSDFMAPMNPEEYVQKNAAQTSSTVATPTVQTVVSLTKKNVKSGPFSIDEMSLLLWENNTSQEANLLRTADDAKGIFYQTDANTGLPVERRDRWKGHNSYTAASNDSGYVTMNPRDQSPFDALNGAINSLNFHARFNESLRGRTELNPDIDTTHVMEGVMSGSNRDSQPHGHTPLETNALFGDFISSATPRSVGPTTIVGADNNEYTTSTATWDGEEATTYSTLVPDGAFLTSANLRYFWRRNLRITYSLRGSSRPPRLKILRYPCGSHEPQFPFMPIQPAGDPSAYPQGVRDEQLPASVWGPSPDHELARARLQGIAPPYRGSDEHNKRVEDNRQRFSNMPYYEGTVDFWIKWDFPAQGSEKVRTVASMGEIDPASHNFAGLFGATAFGRMRSADVSGYDDYDTMSYRTEPRFNSAASDQRDFNADFEGVQFFVYKEPGGWLRFTRLYFSEAFGQQVNTGSTTSGATNITTFGRAMRRIVDPDPARNPTINGVIANDSPFTATNDICNDIGFANDNMGFLYARTDGWVDLNAASFTNDRNTKFVLRPHDWHRLTLSYNSNTNQPYRLWIDGRRVQDVVFIDDPFPSGDLGFRNDGHHVDGSGTPDQPIPQEDPSQPTYNIYRTTTKLLEINPEDRLTVGCVFRRQLDTTAYDSYYNSLDDESGADPFVGSTVKPPRPVFKFDSNFVATANATIDDFRISQHVLDGTQQDVTGVVAQIGSRYMHKNDPNANRCYYENGFFPRADDQQLLGQPVRLGTISWTELRPDWDPYIARGLDLPTSARLSMEWAVFENYRELKPDGGENDLAGRTYRGRTLDMTGTDRISDSYWARGGMSLRGAVLPSGQEWGAFVYRAHFQPANSATVNNVTPYLLDVTVTALTPPRKLWFMIEY